jgi:CheY-like chemotaxis protein
VQPGEQFGGPARAPAARALPDLAMQALPSLAGQHVLVVDDEQDGRDFLALLLRQAGARVSLASNGAAALSLLENGGITVLISDLTMPGMDGYDLVKRLRGMSGGAQVPAIAVSAHVRADEAGAALSAGYDLHVGKPVDVAHLVTAIDALTNIRGSRTLQEP